MTSQKKNKDMQSTTTPFKKLINRNKIIQKKKMKE